MKPPNTGNGLTDAASNALIINGYAGYFYDEFDIEPPKGDDPRARLFNAIQTYKRLQQTDDDWIDDFLLLLSTASSFHLRESVMIRGDASKPVNLMNLTKSELIFAFTTRIDPADIIAASHDDREYISAPNENTETENTETE